MGYSDFPFTIEQIALDLLNLKERHRGAVSFDVDCLSTQPVNSRPSLRDTLTLWPKPLKYRTWESWSK